MTIGYLDDLLKQLYNSKQNVQASFFEHIHAEYNKVHPVSVTDMLTLLYKLVDDKYVTKKPISITKTNLSTEEVLNEKSIPAFYISFEGIIFFKRGGYIKERTILNRKNNWIRAKTLAAILNAIMILVIATWSVVTAMQANDDKVKVNELNKSVDSLNTIINQLRKQRGR